MLFFGVGVLFLGQLEAFKALVGYRRGSLARFLPACFMSWFWYCKSPWDF